MVKSSLSGPLGASPRRLMDKPALESNRSVYPHPPSTNQSTASQLSPMSKFLPTSRPEENSKPRLSDLLATINHLHATPKTVKFHSHAVSSSDFTDVGLRTAFTVQITTDKLS
ncbi:hypothetical protein TNCV_4854871 [Trichonephila clavipes]|nr:hypothetical protein TNCV_4854871 [Trichonephila clavipes]